MLILTITIIIYTLHYIIYVCHGGFGGSGAPANGFTALCKAYGWLVVHGYGDGVKQERCGCRPQAGGEVHAPLGVGHGQAH